MDSISGEEPMLADLTLLLHEMSDALRGRAATHPHRLDVVCEPVGLTSGFSILVSGLASSGKTQLIEALSHQFSGRGVVVRALGDGSDSSGAALRVHAESDLEALVEGDLAAAERRAAAAADIVVPVEWEPLARSIARITEALVARGADAARIGVS
jgi:hypothetical protein